MSLINFSIILISVFLNSLAQIFLKKGSIVMQQVSFQTDIFFSFYKIISNSFIIFGLVCYGLSIGIWILALSRVEVSTAYPMLSIGFIISALVAYYFLGESMDPFKIIGTALIVIGVILISRS